MTTLREYFETEAADTLDALERLVDLRDPGDPRELYRLARLLRGGARMAREDRVYRAAVGLESAARAVAGGTVEWQEDTRARVVATIADLRRLVTSDASASEQEAIVAGVLERWLQIGVPLPEAEIGRTLPGTGAEEETSGSADAFRSFAASEIAGIAETLSRGIEGFVRNPMDREPLRAILRRQRALLGTARLDEIAVVAEALRAVEDLSRVIVRLGVGIKDEWLDVFRSARDIMRAAADALARGETPGPTNALSRLRTLHSEILERYGASEAAPPEAVVSASIGTAEVPANASAPEQPATPELDVHDLMYDRDEAVRRIFELRPRLERITRADPDASAAVEELFDLLKVVLE